MKIIISHDVDHLYGRDHWFRDMIYPKMWVRSTLQLFKGSITFKEWFLRCVSCFQRRRHRLPEVMDFDAANGVPSTFFFGMTKGLGMSYKPKEAKGAIESVRAHGFAAGVHGIAYNDPAQMKREYDNFVQTVGVAPCGIRMHYVRFDDTTFTSEAEIGYVFDSSEFDKANRGTLKAPYKVGNMWEFPLAVMDGYLTQSFEKAKEETLARLQECREAGLEYVCILFHDYQFSNAHRAMRDWYVWLIKYLAATDGYSFVSYGQAMAELEGTAWK